MAEWSGKLGGVKRRAVRSRGCLGQASLGKNSIKKNGDYYAVFSKSCAGAGAFERDETSTQA
jgi:hypothetical protein